MEQESCKSSNALCSALTERPSRRVPHAGGQKCCPTAALSRLLGLTLPPTKGRDLSELFVHRVRAENVAPACAYGLITTLTVPLTSWAKRQVGIKVKNMALHSTRPKQAAKSARKGTLSTSPYAASATHRNDAATEPIGRSNDVASQIYLCPC